MRKVMIFIVINFMIISIIAQNYQCLKLDAISHFVGTNGQIASIRIDTIIQNDSITDYVSFHMIRPIGNVNYPMVHTLKGASWIGEKYRVKQSGDKIFYNAMHEPIKFKDITQNTGSWEMYKSEANNIVVTANLTNINYESILGLSDSVALITMIAKDTNGVIVNNPLNNYTLRLSKNYGLLNILNFYKFPFVNQIGEDWIYNISDCLSLIGMTNPEIGWQNLTAIEIFNWQPDWEFHTLETTSGPIGPGYYNGYSKQMIRKILTRDEDLDSIKFEVARCYYIREFNNVQTTNEIHNQDTITEKYCINSNNNFNKLPNEPLSNSGLITFYIKDTISIMEQSQLFFNQHNDTCEVLMYDGYTNNTWTKELGNSYHGEGFYGDQSDGNFVYFKKGLVEWGTPYVCSILLDNDLTYNNQSVDIYPNPNNGRFKIDINSYKNLEINLFDISGKELYDLNIYGNHEEINLINFESGFYFIKIKRDNDIFVKRLQIIR